MANHCSNTLIVFCDKKHKTELIEFKNKVCNKKIVLKKKLREEQKKYLAENKAKYVEQRRLADFVKHSTMHSKKFFKEVLFYRIENNGDASTGEDFSLDTLLPCPDELLKVTVPVRAENGETEQEFKERTEKHKALYGYTDWYSWQNSNWGTKWVENHSEPEQSQNKTTTTLTYGFTSAWSPPVAWLFKIAPQFPNLHFELQYEEPGCGFKGEATAHNDEVTDECYDWTEPCYECEEEFDENGLCACTREEEELHAKAEQDERDAKSE